jgi:hypothetical protein
MVKKDISCIIIDDEPLSVELLESYAKNCADTLLVTKIYQSHRCITFFGNE